MNKLFLLPTNATKDALKDILGASPVMIDWDSLGVEIASSVSPIVPNEDAVYRALTGEMNVWYESAVGRSSLLLTLIPSPEMVSRHEEIGDAWDRPDFFPFMLMAKDPILRRNRRAFFNSVSNRFVDLPVVLTFHGEVVVENDDVVPSQQDFYVDYANKRALNQLPNFA